MSEQERPDRLRLGRLAPISSARREKQALQPSDVRGRGRGRGRVGGTRLATVDVAGGSTSQTGPSHIVDPTQYQHEQHYQEQAYEEQHYQEQPEFQSGFQYQEGYEYHQGYQPQFDEGYQPEQPHQQQYVEPPQQQYVDPPQQQPEQHPQHHAELGMEDEDGGFPGGPYYELSLLLDFGKHVACKLWNDKTVSIICFI